jgi:hypothetical protein
MSRKRRVLPPLGGFQSLMAANPPAHAGGKQTAAPTWGLNTTRWVPERFNSRCEKWTSRDDLPADDQFRLDLSPFIETNCVMPYPPTRRSCLIARVGADLGLARLCPPEYCGAIRVSPPPPRVWWGNIAVSTHHLSAFGTRGLQFGGTRGGGVAILATGSRCPRPGELFRPIEGVESNRRCT